MNVIIVGRPDNGKICTSLAHTREFHVVVAYVGQAVRTSQPNSAVFEAHSRMLH